MKFWLRYINHAFHPPKLLVSIIAGECARHSNHVVGVMQEGVVIQHYVAIWEGELLRGHIWILMHCHRLTEDEPQRCLCAGMRWQLPHLHIPQWDGREGWKGIIGNIIWLCRGRENDFSYVLSEWKKGKIGGRRMKNKPEVKQLTTPHGEQCETCNPSRTPVCHFFQQ